MILDDRKCRLSNVIICTFYTMQVTDKKLGTVLPLTMFQQFQGGEAAVMEMDPIDERLVAFEDDLGEDTDSSGEEVQVNKLTKMLLAFVAFTINEQRKYEL